MTNLEYLNYLLQMMLPSTANFSVKYDTDRGILDYSPDKINELEGEENLIVDAEVYESDDCQYSIHYDREERRYALQVIEDGAAETGDQHTAASPVSSWRTILIFKEFKQAAEELITRQFKHELAIVIAEAESSFQG